MSSDKTGATDDIDLPLLYRVILKFPRLSLDGFSDRFQGVFWVLVLPLLLMGDFYATVFFLMWMPFPFNLMLTIGLTLVVILLILRILLERAVISERAIRGDTHFCWDVEKSLQEYEELLQDDDEETQEKKQS